MKLLHRKMLHEQEGSPPSSLRKGVIEIAIYYELLKSRAGLRWRERNGVKIKNDYGLELFGEKRNGEYIITEGTTGGKFSAGSLKKEAIDKLDDTISRRGIDHVKTRIENLTDAFGVSPLYSDETTIPIIPLKEEA